MNVSYIIGNLTRDPDTRSVGETSVCTFTVAVQRRFKDRNGEKITDFINVVAWRKTAELCAQYLTKGSKVAVNGELQTRSYTDKEGIKRTVAEIVADNVEFLTQRKQYNPDDFEDAELADGELPF